MHADDHMPAVRRHVHDGPPVVATVKTHNLRTVIDRVLGVDDGFGPGPVRDVKETDGEDEHEREFHSPRGQEAGAPRHDVTSGGECPTPRPGTLRSYQAGGAERNECGAGETGRV